MIPPGQQPPPIETGLYQHHKGNWYLVTGTRWHSETLEPMVDYKTVGSKVPWSRPLPMFFEQVLIDGNLVPRWRFIRPLSGGELLDLAQELIAKGDVEGAIEKLSEHARRFPTSQDGSGPTPS